MALPVRVREINLLVCTTAESILPRNIPPGLFFQRGVLYIQSERAAGGFVITKLEVSNTGVPD